MSQQITPPDFIIIPRQLLLDDNIQPLDCKVFGYIYWFTKLKNEKCTAGNKTLAELVGATSTSVRNSLTRLERCGYIAKIYADDAKKIRLEIICLLSFGVHVASNDTYVASGSAKVASNDDTTQQGYVASGDAQKKNIKRKVKKNNTHTSEFDEESIPEQIREAFTDFVSMYTAKYGKFTDVSKKQTLGKLNSWYKDKPLLQIECLNKAARMGWKGIWKLDEKEIRDIEANGGKPGQSTQGWKPEDDAEWEAKMEAFRNGGEA